MWLTWKEYDQIYATYENGNISTAREKVHAMNPGDIMLMTAYLLTRHHPEDVKKFAVRMSE